MSALHWFYDAHVTISGHQITWREIIGNAFGLASALGGMLRRVWAWPVGIVGNVLLFTVFLGVAFGNAHGAPLYGQASRQVFFIVVSVFGWSRWAQTRRAAVASGEPPTAVTPRWAQASQRAAYIAAAAIGVVGCFLVFREIGAGFPVPWWYYLADSWIFVGSMLATYAMARGWVDFWLCWIAVDFVGVPELIHFQYYPSAALYGFYAGFVLWGFFVWRRIAAREVLSVGVAPRPDEVPA